MNAIIYARVSTTKQAQKDLSIPDQVRQMHEFCRTKGYEVTREFIEPGASATDGRRPIFQQMLDDIYSGKAPVDLIIVHSLSRFYRDFVESSLCERKLKRHGVRLISVTQQTPDDSTGEMLRGFIGLFDEYQSKENSKHTLRALIECARQGYFPGSRAPFGYKRELVAGAAEGRKKWRLVIDDPESEVVRQIFHLSVHGQEGIPYGVKRITEHLNDKGMLKRGKKWSRASVGDILNDSVYLGEYYFNKKCAKTREQKPRKEWVPVTVPAIVTKEIFDKSSKGREVRAPATKGARSVSSPTLLTGLLKCDCGASMTLATGKGGRYSYYKCTQRINVSKDACASKNIPMNKLDCMVMGVLADRVFQPERVNEIISQCQNRLRNSFADEKRKLGLLQRESENLKGVTNRVLDAIGDGLPYDDAVKEKIQSSRNRQEEIKNEIATLERIIDIKDVDITPDIVKGFALS